MHCSVQIQTVSRPFLESCINLKNYWLHEKVVLELAAATKLWLTAYFGFVKLPKVQNRKTDFICNMEAYAVWYISEYQKGETEKETERENYKK